MDFGEAFSGTLKLIWRQKKLWGLGMLGVLLSALGLSIYLGVGVNWYTRFMAFALDPALQQGLPPDEVTERMFRSMAGLFSALGVLGCLSLIGYIVSLITRGAIIGEAGGAWGGDSVQVRRGLRTGASKALAIFAIDIVWWLPIVLVFGCIYLVGAGLMVGAIGAVEETGAGGEAGAFVGMMGGIFGFIGLIACLGLLIAVIQGIFAPLMYQSAVQGGRNIGDAIREGFVLARRNLGNMVILLIIVFLMTLAGGVITQLASLPIVGASFSGFSTLFAELGQSSSIQPPGPINTLLLLLGGLLVGLATLVVNGFLQAFNLALYARAYQQFSAEPEVVEVTPEPAE